MINAESEAKAALRKAATVIHSLEKRLQALQAERSEPIAIVGAGCRLPGGVSDLAALGALLRAGIDAVGPIPKARFDAAEIYDPDPAASGKSYARGGAFLETVDRFDPGFFSVSPREAAWVDPQHRLLIECAWEALEDAGAPPDRLRSSRVGVFVGIGPSDYAKRIATHAPEALEGYAATGTGACFSAGRLSFLLGVQGPSLAVDTACSSSLVALHLACQALRAGECEVALAGGVQVMLSPEPFILLSRLRALAPDGRCKSFSDRADGYGRGEGCGVVALKRLSRAQRDGDRILALVRGSAVNHDGPSSGLTTPNGGAQREVIRQALAAANLSPADVDCVEAHGTGTSLGDPIEIEALAAVYGAERKWPLAVGTVKSNIGHLESASGIAGVLKILAALNEGILPKSLHSERLNPHIEWDSLPLRIQQQTEEWPARGRPRRAGVSSFGMSGTNVHAVLEEAPAVGLRAVARARPAELFVISARTKAALSDAARLLGDHLEAHPDAATADLAFSLATAKAHHPHRLAIVAPSREALRTLLGEGAAGGGLRGEARPRRGRMAFLFTGQGAQLAGMGRGLHQAWPAFREAWERCAALFDGELERPLCDIAWAAPGSAEVALLDQTGYTQPALFAFEHALAALWRSWGVEPDLVAGHSIGELVAACFAGVFSLEDAARLVSARARLMQALAPGGAMVAVAGPASEIERAIAGDPEVALAAVNSPQSVVLSGSEARVLAFAEVFAARGMRVKRLTVSHAFHSPLMAPMLSELRRVAAEIEYRQSKLSIVSTLTGKPAGKEIATADYWVRQVRETVRFGDAVQALSAASVSTFIEIGPRPTLLPLVASSPGGADAALVPSVRADRNEPEAVLSALGSWYTRGGAISWSGLFPEGGRRVSLPRYPWQRERHWVELARQSRGPQGAAGQWPLSGVELRLPGSTWHHVVAVAPDRPSFVKDHVVFGKVVIAGAVHVSIILAVAAEHWPGRALELGSVEFLRARPLEAGEEIELHVRLTREDKSEGCAFEIVSLTGMAGAEQWTTHVRGRVGPTAARPGELPSPESLAARAARPVEPSQIFQSLSEMRIDWGPGWRWIESAHLGPGASLATMQPTSPLAHRLAPLHPSLVDNAFAASLLESLTVLGGGTPRLPFAVDRLRWWRIPQGKVRCAAVPQPGAKDVSDFVLVDEDFSVVAEVVGFACREAPRDRFFDEAAAHAQKPAARPSLDEAFFELGWVDAPVPPAKATPRRWLLVDGGEPGSTLGQTLGGKGHEVAHAIAANGAELDERLSRAFEGRGPTDIVHLGSLRATEGLSAAGLEASLVAGCDGVLAILQAVAKAGLGAAPRLWLVTRGAQPAGEVSAVQAPLLGLARAIALEHPELRCARIDLDPSRAEDEIEELAAELLADDAEAEVALRRAGRRVARLQRFVPEEAGAGDSTGGNPRAAVRADGTYLVTGGLGGLGLGVARWLAERGAGHLVLLGRSEVASQAQREAIAALRQGGAEVTVARADVSDRAELARVLDAVSPPERPLRGVVHAAGVIDDALLSRQTPERFRRVMASKALGALHLHELTRRAPLDFFVLYSSAAALLGSPGQGNYAAANAFLDGLAAERRSLGLPALSIAWGPFAGVGMAAAREGFAARLSEKGISPLSPGDGLAALERLLCGDRAQAAVLSLDARRWVTFHPQIAASRMLSTLLAAGGPGDARADRDLPARWMASAPEQRAALLLDLVRTHVAQVLRLAANGLDVEAPFATLGMDSLTGLELRNRLVAELGLELPATLIFQAETIAAVTRLLADALLRAAVQFENDVRPGGAGDLQEQEEGRL